MSYFKPSLTFLTLAVTPLVIGQMPSIAVTLSDFTLLPESLSTQDIPADYQFFNTGKVWTEEEKNVVREAIKEWDDIICNCQSFFETTGDDWDISLRWAGSEIFKDWTNETGFENSGWDLTNALAIWTPKNLSPPWDTNIYPNMEIYFNTQIDWYVDPDPTDDEIIFKGFDLLTIAKHEFGHALGIRGDWGQNEPYEDTNGNGQYDPGEPFTDVNGDGMWGTRALSWTKDDEAMWGVFAGAETFTDQNGNGEYDPGEPFVDSNGNGQWDSAQRNRLKPSDIRALRELNAYHVNVPEPTSTLSILSLGILGVGATLKRKVKRNHSIKKEPTNVG